MSIEIDGGLGTMTMKHFYDAMDKEYHDWLPKTNERFIKITSDEGGNYVLGKLIYRPPKPEGYFYGVNKSVWELIFSIPTSERPQTLQDLISKVKGIAKGVELDDYVILASFFYSGVGAVPNVLYEQAVDQAIKFDYETLLTPEYGGLIAHLCWYKVNSESTDKVNGDPLVIALTSEFNNIEDEIYIKFKPDNISTWPKETDPVYNYYKSLQSSGDTGITEGITTDITKMQEAFAKFKEQGGGNLTRRKANKRKAIRRKSMKRKSMKRKSMKRKSMKRRKTKRKATRRKNSKRKNTRRRRR
jgi:hypothetical protein